MSDGKGARRGGFISFEGIDGAGKSTHVGACVAWLRTRGEQVVLSREPGGSPLAEMLRQLLLKEEMQPQTETLLAFAARSDHLHRVIRPALLAGQWVVCDRFTDSTFAYQGGGSGVDPTWLGKLEAEVQAGLNPDRTYLFDLPVETAERRRAAVRVADRFEGRDADYFDRVRQAYLSRVAADPSRFRVLDATASPEQITEWLMQDLEEFYTSREQGGAAGAVHGVPR
ncbi:MAG: dTMP kinase [Lautropia sp.]|nr:dTMP kinase [Lautropia sp.]